MASSQVRAAANKFEASEWRNKKEWRQYERVGMRPDLSLDDIQLSWVHGKAVGLEFKGAITSMNIHRSVEQASSITVTLIDPGGQIFSKAAKRMRNSLKKKHRLRDTPAAVDEAWDPINMPILIGRAIDLTLDGVVFRLVKVGYVESTSEVTLTFEDRAVYWLRRKKGKRKAVSRNDSTRAEFVLGLVREVKAETIPFVCPELHKKQKIAPAEGPNG